MFVVLFTWLTLKVTRSPATMGTVLAVEALPLLLLGPVAGALVDRLPKRGLMNRW